MYVYVCKQLLCFVKWEMETGISLSLSGAGCCGDLERKNQNRRHPKLHVIYSLCWVTWNNLTGTTDRPTDRPTATNEQQQQRIHLSLTLPCCTVYHPQPLIMEVVHNHPRRHRRRCRHHLLWQCWCCSRNVLPDDSVAHRDHRRRCS